jgi:tryptophan-rich sensory protein
MDNKNNLWYKELKKPSWAPHSWLYSIVWSILYVLIAISFGKAAMMYFQNEIAFAVLIPFILNLVFNFAFTSIQFGLKNNFLATIDILLVLATLIWLTVTIYQYSEWVAYLQLPYLGWIIFAAILQLTITAMNVGKKSI